MKSLTLYQIHKSHYKITFPKVIVKILDAGGKVNLLCKNKDEMEYLDNLMWTFSQLSFIPHSTENDKFNEELQDLVIAINSDHLTLHNKFLILSSVDLLTKFNVDLVNDIFIITTNTINAEYLFTKLDGKLFNNKMKLFVQDIDNTWKIDYNKTVE
jgi:DNA polymerase-3 subunit chi